MARRVDLEEAIHLFLQSKKTGSTRIAYAHTLVQAQEMLEAMKLRRVGSIEFTHAHALFYSPSKGWPSRRPAPSAGTMNNHRSRLNAFFSWCVRMGYMERNFITPEDIPRFRGEDVLKRRFSHDEIDLILKYIDNPRDRALLVCTAYTGLRISEVLSLKISKVDLDREELNYYDQKNKQWKWKAMYSDLVDEIRAWLGTYEEWLGSPLKGDMFLFPRVERPGFHREQGWTPVLSRAIYPYQDFRGKYQMLNALLDKVDKAEDLRGDARLNRKGQAFHMFRRSIARLMYDALAADAGSKDKALRMVQTFLGHSTRAITERYIGLDTEHEELSTYIKGRRFRPLPPATSATNVIPLRKVESA